MGVNDVLRLHRLERQLSQEQFAEKIYESTGIIVNQQYISDIETGRKQAEIDVLLNFNKVFESDIIVKLAFAEQAMPALKAIRV